MKLVCGYVRHDGQFDSNYGDESNDFVVEKTADGVYKIIFSHPFDQYPVMALTPISGYMTANAVLSGADAYGGWAEIRTGYTDKPSTEYMDCSFYFTAVGDPRSASTEEILRLRENQ